MQFIQSSYVKNTLDISTWIDYQKSIYLCLGYNYLSEYYFGFKTGLDNVIPKFNEELFVGSFLYFPTSTFDTQQGIGFEVFVSYLVSKRPNLENLKNQKRIYSPVFFE